MALMAVIWGIPYLLIRIAVRQLDPGVLVLGRTAPASLLLWPIVFRRRQVKLVLDNFFWIATFGVVEFGIPWYLMATAEKHITSSLTSLMICCVPLFGVAFQRLTKHEDKISPRRLLGLLIGAAGAVLLVGLDISGGSLPWILVMIVICVGYTAGPIILDRKLHHVPGPAVVAGATAFVSLCWIPWDVFHWPSHVSGETISCVATLSVVCTAAAFVTFYELIKEVAPTRSMVVIYINTAIAVVLGIVFLHEPLTTGIALGFPLVLLGSYFATSANARASVS